MNSISLCLVLVLLLGPGASAFALEREAVREIFFKAGQSDDHAVSSALQVLLDREVISSRKHEPRASVAGNDGQQDPLGQMAARLASGISADPSTVKHLFSKDMLEHWEGLSELLRKIHDDHGSVVRVKQVERFSSTYAHYFFFFEGNLRMLVKLHISEPPHKIDGLRFDGATPVDDSFARVRADLEKLPGISSLTLMKLDEVPGTVVGFNSEVALAIGSTFKLYLLGALLDEIEAGDLRWDDVILLKEKQKSLPSGKLQDWPASAPLTLHTLASLMISISDNTATDHLLFHLGRDKAESMLARMGNTNPERTIPFLATYEMFLIKLHPEGKLGPAFIEANLDERRLMLTRLDHDELEILEPNPRPTWIDQIEWFASTRDLCRAMDWLRKKSRTGPASKVRGILSINPAFNFGDDDWRYVGYKGGSEPGVLNLTFLLQRKNGEWYALSAGWNDPRSALDGRAFFAIIQRCFDLLVEEGSAAGQGSETPAPGQFSAEPCE